jgi:hypothetical protein
MDQTDANTTSSAQSLNPQNFHCRKLIRAAILLAGLLLPQAILFGPSLIGRRILMPLDFLQLTGVYLPPQSGNISAARDVTLYDQTYQLELFRRYAVSEIRAGRLPLWNTYNYCGSPFLANNQSAVLSPLRLPDYLWPGPWVLAWDELFKSVLAGIGAYLFFRCGLQVRFGPACVGAWCYPLCGFLMLWEGHMQSAAAAWLPWIMLGVDRAIRYPYGRGTAVLALVTGAALVAGHAEVAGHALLASGFYAIFRLFQLSGWRGVNWRIAVAAALAVAGGWILGILLSAPQTLPSIAYLSDSYRIANREMGMIESPPVGLDAAWDFLFPYWHGSTQLGSAYIGTQNRQESAASGYVGLIVALVAAPWAFFRKRLRGEAALWLILAILAAGQILAIPGLAQVYSSYPLRLLCNNRFIFISGFAVLCLGVIGLDYLWEMRQRPRIWCLAVILPPLILGFWCNLWATQPPQQFTAAMTWATAEMKKGNVVIPSLQTQEMIDHAFQRFASLQYLGEGACAVAVMAGIALVIVNPRRSLLLWGVGALCVGELIVMAWGVNPQSDPALYYQPIPALEALAGAPPGRIFGMIPCLNLVNELKDIRGYDGADPARILELLMLFRDDHFPPGPGYEPLATFVPKIYRLDPLKLSPLADLLNLRYLIVHTDPPADQHPAIQSPGYWVIENSSAMPRAFVPSQAIVANDEHQRLATLADPNFDPRATVLLETNDPLPPGPYVGSAAIDLDEPEHVTIKLNMQTPGVVVLADSWDAGWKARMSGRDLPVMIADHALRAVTVPAGEGTLEFSYEPASFTWGVRLAIAAFLAIIFVTAWDLSRFRRRL